MPWLLTLALEAREAALLELTAAIEEMPKHPRRARRRIDDAKAALRTVREVLDDYADGLL